MNAKLKLLLIFFSLNFCSISAQITYFKTVDGVLMTEENYLEIKNEIKERKDLKDLVQEILVKTETQNDTIIKTIKFEKLILALNQNKKRYDVYAEQRKMIGTHFPIELFENENGENFSADFLKGKPTLVNFWFTNCPPCIEEITDFHHIKDEFGDSVNYVAITFENKKIVNKFLDKGAGFDFSHIINAEKPINKLKIKSYPVTFLLNSEGDIINVYGMISYDVKGIKQLISILLD